MKKIIIIALILSTVHSLQSTVSAQELSLETYRYADEAQLWRYTQNAAGLSLDSLATRGIADFNYSHRNGDFHRVQDGGMNNNLEFFTERYQKVGKYLYGYGSFKFDMGRTKDRAWSDVIRSYNSNPFISGSNVYGKYDNQDFELDASLATIPLGKFTYGGNLFYKVGDLSRLRDPRSRINLAEYRLTPAVTYTSGSSTFGLSAHYDRRKEKLLGLTTVQTDPNLKYYVMTGLATATGTIGGYKGYMREYVNHEFGATLTYGTQWSMVNGKWSTLNTLSFAHGTEYVYGTNKYEPGRYFSNKYGFASQNRLRAGRLLHRADLSLQYEEAYGDEYRQERISETDSVTGFNSVWWNTVLTYKKRHQMKKTDASLHYRGSVVDGHAVNGWFGLEASFQSVRIKHLLPTDELKYGSTLLQLEGGVPLFGKGHCHPLWLEAKAGYVFASDADLTLNDVTSEYASAVILPDMAILGADYFTGSMKLTLQLPVTLEKKTRNWFVSAYGHYVSAKGDLNRYQIGVSLGLYY